MRLFPQYLQIFALKKIKSHINSHKKCHNSRFHKKSHQTITENRLWSLENSLKWLFSFLAISERKQRRRKQQKINLFSKNINFSDFGLCPEKAFDDDFIFLSSKSLSCIVVVYLTFFAVQKYLKRSRKWEKSERDLLFIIFCVALGWRLQTTLQLFILCDY